MELIRTARIRIVFASLFLASFFPAHIRSEDNRVPGVQLDTGKVWASFVIEPKAAEGRYSHAGWDFYHGSSKQFYVGSGWMPADRGKWGLWSPVNNRFDFHAKFKRPSSVTLVVLIDFGIEESGDETVALWVDPPAGRTPTEKSSIAHLGPLKITGVDRLKLFSHDSYSISKVSFSRTFDALIKPTSSSTNASGERLFLSKVQPLFQEKCAACHGTNAKELKGQFDMRTREALFKGGESGEPAIDLKKPNESLLLTAIKWENGLEMPPKANDRLSAAQVEWVREWIASGAPWPSASNSSEEDIAWSAPDADGEIRVRTSGGQSESWTNRRYSPAGLWAYRPLKEINVPWDSLASGDSRHPVEAFIQRKLSERGITSADRADRKTLIRRASYDLTGLPPTADQIEAFADDDSPTAYSELIDRLLESPHYGERMAQHWLDVVRYADTNGFSRDEFRPDAHRYRTYVIRSFNEDKPFDAFIREQIAGDLLKLEGQDALSMLWMGPWEQTSMSVAAVTRQLWLDDVVNSIGVSFLGQQLRCAKCHDHKFDPIPTRDYYSLQAVFSSTKHSAGGGRFKIQAQSPKEVYILNGGALESPGDAVSPGAMSVIATTAKHEFSTTPGIHPRAALARWVAHPKNPLTTRVLVNRVWQMHFGRGLVATPNDFGKMGAAPSHPELLDWLTHWFIENNWSVKRLHQLLMSSPSYCRASSHRQDRSVRESDPNNQLLSHFPPRRLSSEEIRDTMLSITGELNPEIGGPSVRPEINWEVAFQPRLAMGKLVPPYQPDPARKDRNRRSIYAVRIRNLGNPFMEVFNRPGSNLSCERRDQTTITPQVFTLLHGEFSHERSLALAERVTKSTNLVADQVKAAYRSIYGRLPTQKQLEAAVKHVEEMTTLHEKLALKPSKLPASVTLQNIKEKTGEPERITFRLNRLDNYEEDLKPWDVTARTRALADLCLVLFNSSEFLYVY